jgi:hypothetical protein
MRVIVPQLNKLLLHKLFASSLNIVFNVCMTDKDDKTLILDLGGPAKVAEILGFDKPGGVQRVQNWMTRGIPAQQKVDRPDLFMPHLRFSPNASS